MDCVLQGVTQEASSSTTFLTSSSSQVCIMSCRRLPCEHPPLLRWCRYLLATGEGMEHALQVLTCRQ